MDVSASVARETCHRDSPLGRCAGRPITGLVSRQLAGYRYGKLVVWRIEIEADRGDQIMTSSAQGERHTRSVFICSLFLCLAASSVFAQFGGRPPETIYRTDWNERLNPNIGLKAHDDGLLDDKIDFSTGRLSFETVDVSLPGNSALPVEIRRRRNPSQAFYNEFADWQLAVPSISTKIPQLEVTKGLRWGKTRCGASLASSIPPSTFGVNPFGGTAPPLPASKCYLQLHSLRRVIGHGPRC